MQALTQNFSINNVEPQNIKQNSILGMIFESRNKVLGALQKKILNWENREFFSHPCLNQSNPLEYFKEVSHSIDITQLYKIVDTCYYNQEMPIYPVLVEISQEKLREFYGGYHYLLQVWHIDSKKKLLQVPLHQRIKKWEVCYDYFVYTLHDDDEDSDCLHLHYLTTDEDEENKHIKIKDIGLSHDVSNISYYDKNLYISKGQTIEIYSLTEDHLSSEEPIDSSELTPQVIDTGLLIKAMIQTSSSNDLNVILVVLETMDNQLDFNQLYLGEQAAEKSGKDGQEYLLVQCAPRVKRESSSHDPITNFIIRHKTGTESATYAVAVRQSKGVDLYYNMSRVNSAERFDAVSINCSFKMALIKQRKLISKTAEEYSENFDSENITIDPEDPKYHFVFRDVTFGKQMDAESSYQANSESDVLHIYDSTYEQLHLEIAAKIVQFFSSVDMIQTGFQAIFSHDKFISTFSFTDFKWDNHFELEDVIKSLVKIKLEGKDGQCSCLAILENNKIVKIDFDNLDEDGIPEITDYFEDETYEILAWTIDQEECFPLILGLKNKETSEITIHQIDNEGSLELIETTNGPIYDRFGMVALRSEGKLYLVLQNDDEVQVYHMDHGEDYDDEEKYYESFLDSQKELDIDGTIHSVCSKNPKKHLILFDQTSAYILKFNPHYFKKIEKQYVKYAGNDESMDFYFVAQDNEQVDNVRNEIKYLDIMASIKNNEISLLPIVQNANNANSKVYVGLNKQRIGFFRALNEFIVTICPNRSYNSFFTPIQSNDFVFYRQIKDRVIILTNENKLLTFDVVTGKLLFENPANIDLKGFEQFNVRGYQTTMFRSCDPLDKEVDYSEFYPQQQLETTTSNQLSFRETQCPRQLHLFREVEIINEYEIKLHMEFEYPFDESKKLRFVSNEKKDQILITDDFGVSINQVVRGKGSQVKFQLLRAIDEYPHHLHVHYGYRADIFTPDFSKFINTEENGCDSYTFYIQDTMTGQKLCDIPTSILEYNKDERYPNLNPQMLINKLQWVNSKVLRVINDEGIEKLFDTDNDFKELKFNYIPLFKELCIEEWLQEYHLIISRPRTNDPVVKLQRCYQEYKSLYNLLENATRSDFNVLQMKQDFEIFECFTHSFTVMSWNVAWRLQNGQLKISQLGESTIVGLLYAIFPGGNTILHYLCNNQTELQNLLEFCHPEGKTIQHHIPFLKNAEGKTPLHICIDKQSSKSINLFLKHLSLYPADHHSKAIKDIYHKLVELKLADFDTYMESRFQQMDQHKTIDKLKISFESVGFTTSSPWINKDQIYDEFLDYEEGIERKVKVETLDIAGIYHYNDPDEDKFFDALASCDSFEYFELKSIQALIDFNYPHVQKYLIRKLFVPYMVFHAFYLLLIFVLFENRYDLDYMYIYWSVLAINLGFASYFILNELRQIKNDGMNYFTSFWNYIDIVPVFGIYAIAVFSIIDASVHFSINPDERVSQTIQRIVVSIVTLFMWLKFLYFFRIFDKTSYLIRAIVEVVYTMRHFFLVLTFGVVGFGNAFLVISLGNEPSTNPEENPIFIDNYINSILFSYRMLLGDFDTGAFGEVAVPLVWIFFLIFTVFNMIVMLNLLIAVISDAYAAVAEVATQAMYQERASMIAENNYLIPEDVKKNYCEENRLILMITDLEDEERPTGNDAVIKRINETKDEIVQEIVENKNEQQKQHDDLFKLVEQIKQFQLQTLPSETIMTKLSKHKLTKCTLFQMNLIHEGEYESWGCDGRTFTGCKAKEKQENLEARRTDPKEKLHHCGECGFDMCIDCYASYGDIHHHSTELITLEEVRNRQDGYGDGWGCDCRNFKGCEDNIDSQHKASDFDIVYHNKDEYFDLCPKCADFYKIKE